MGGLVHPGLLAILRQLSRLALGGTNFARPLVNLAFRIEGWLTPAVGDPAYLLAGCLALVLTTFLLTGVFRKYANVGPVAAIVLSVSVGLSPIWYSSLSSASFCTNTLALLFSVGALLALDPARGWPRGWRLTACVAFLVLAVASHETAVLVPLLCVALLLWLSPGRPQIRDVLPFSVPVVFLVAERLVLQSPGGVYALGSTSTRMLVERVKRVVVDPLVSYDPARFLAERHALTLSSGLIYALALLANLVVTAAIVYGLYRSRDSRNWWLLAAIGIALVPSAVMFSDPRFAGLLLVVSLLAAARFTSSDQMRLLRRTMLACVLVAELALFWGGVVHPRESELIRVEHAGTFMDSARSATVSDTPNAVVLVDDDVGLYGAFAMLQMAAWPRQVLDLTVINGYEGGPSADATVRVARTGEGLSVESRLGTGQGVLFAGTVPDFSVPNNGFVYIGVPKGAGPILGSFRAVRPRVPARTLVLGVNPADGSVLSPTLY